MQILLELTKEEKKLKAVQKTITIDKIDSVLPEADFLYLALPETPETKNLINKKRLRHAKNYMWNCKYRKTISYGL